MCTVVYSAVQFALIARSREFDSVITESTYFYCHTYVYIFDIVNINRQASTVPPYIKLHRYRPNTASVSIQFDFLEQHQNSLSWNVYLGVFLYQRCREEE